MDEVFLHGYANLGLLRATFEAFFIYYFTGPRHNIKSKIWQRLLMKCLKRRVAIPYKAFGCELLGS